MNYLLNFLALFFCAIAFLSVIWILLPAPSYYIWLYSVAVSEWSLWFGVISLAGIIAAIVNYALYKNNGSFLLGCLLIGGISLAISIYPFLASVNVAKEKNVSLSFGNYFNALITQKSIENKFETFVFSTNNKTELKLDVYQPTDQNNRNGASIIVVHGGSWNGGKRNDFPQWNKWLAENGFVVFDIDYTLTPQPNYLSAIGDVKCAVHWVKDHAAKFGISSDKIILLGRSAGAHLALISAYTANDARLPSNCGGNNENVRAVISFYAPTDLIWDYDNLSNQYVIDGPTTLSTFLGGNPHSSAEITERYILASPAKRVTTQTPPTLLIHGGKDQLVREENMNILAEKLTEAKIFHKTLYIPYGQHGFDYNFNGWGSQITKSVILKFINEQVF